MTQKDSVVQPGLNSSTDKSSETNFLAFLNFNFLIKHKYQNLYCQVIGKLSESLKRI
jgi:hypothetical protein